jgi:hypothetical protein
VKIQDHRELYPFPFVSFLPTKELNNGFQNEILPFS